MLRNKYVSVLFSSGGASAITFFSYPLLALLYPLDSFGTFGVLTAYSLILSTLILVRFDYFILSTKRKTTKVRFVVTGLGCCFVFFIPMSVIGVFSGLIYNSWNLILMACLTLSMAVNNILNFFLLTTDHVRTVNFGKFVRAFSIVIFQFGSFYVVGSDFGLVTGQVFGLLVTFFYLLHIAENDLLYVLKKIRGKCFSYKEICIKSLIGRKSDIKFQLPQSGLNSILNNAMPIFVENLFGLKVAGALFLVEKFVKMPVGIIVDSIRPIIISDLSVLECDVAYKKSKNYIFNSFYLAGAFFIILFYLNPAEFEIELAVYHQLAYLVLPVVFFTLSSCALLPAFCFFHAHSQSKLLLKCDSLRVLLLSLLIVIFYFLDFKNEVAFYYAYSLVILLVPLYYFLKRM